MSTRVGTIPWLIASVSGLITVIISRLDKRNHDCAITEIEAVNGSGPVDLWFNDRLRKENRMSSSDSDMIGGELRNEMISDAN